MLSDRTSNGGKSRGQVTMPVLLYHDLAMDFSSQRRAKGYGPLHLSSLRKQLCAELKLPCESFFRGEASFFYRVAVFTR